MAMNQLAMNRFEGLPFPDFAQLREHSTFEEAMQAYAIYARDYEYPYLAAWRPWLHAASRLREFYPVSSMIPDEAAHDTADGRYHFSRRMSVLRNRVVTEVFGFDGVDFTATALRVYNDAVLSAEQNGTLADFRPPTLPFYGVEDDAYMQPGAEVDSSVPDLISGEGGVPYSEERVLPLWAMDLECPSWSD